MQILLPWQAHDLARWQARPLPELRAPDWAFRDHMSVTLAQEPPGPPLPQGPFERVERSIFGYRIFGPGIGLPVLACEPLQLGDTVGLRYRFLPGLDLFFASRVIELFHRQGEPQLRSGFVYRTLPQHPETGEETFEVSKDLVTGEVRLTIHAWSHPGMWLAWLILPLGRAIQHRAARHARSFLSQVANPSGSTQPPRRTGENYLARER